jgi:hypothetical protein
MNLAMAASVPRDEPLLLRIAGWKGPDAGLDDMEERSCLTYSENTQNAHSDGGNRTQKYLSLLALLRL